MVKKVLIIICAVVGMISVKIVAMEHSAHIKPLASREIIIKVDAAMADNKKLSEFALELLESGVQEEFIKHVKSECKGAFVYCWYARMTLNDINNTKISQLERAMREYHALSYLCQARGIICSYFQFARQHCRGIYDQGSREVLTKMVETNQERLMRVEGDCDRKNEELKQVIREDIIARLKIG